MRLLVLAVGFLVAAVVVGSLLLDEGEVVTLVSHDAQGAEYETALWIVEWDGALWLRAGSPRTQWLERLRVHPEVELRRAGETHSYRAVVRDDPATKQGVDAAMAAKYGFADRMWGRIADHGDAVPVRLEPQAAGGAPAARPHAASHPES